MSVLKFPVVEKAWVWVVWRHWAPPRVRVVAKPGALSRVHENRMPHGAKTNASDDGANEHHAHTLHLDTRESNSCLALKEPLLLCCTGDRGVFELA